jgi:exodeoxyribonuclease VIII
MKNLVLDLETMGTGPNAAITAIGAIEVDLKNFTIGMDFYRKVSLISSVECGGTMDADTVLWWLEQSDAARAEFKHGVSLPDALADFSEFFFSYSSSSEIKVWGNGSDFDNVILANAYTSINYSVPWSFRNNRCYRTVLAEFKDSNLARGWIHTRPMLAHHAGSDARAQAENLISIYKLRG